MSVERSLLIRLAGGPSTLDLTGDIESARRRARKALPGDRTDVVRFEALSSQLERAAAESLRSGGEHLEVEARPRTGLTALAASDLEDLEPEVAATARCWLEAGDLIVEVRDPFAVGPTVRPAPTRGAAPVAEVWSAPAGESGRRAVARRFQEQIERVVAGAADAAIVPSGVSNSVLTEGIRVYVEAEGGSGRIDAPVTYRDGSSARSFPLRALRFRDVAAPAARTLRFALLSIRHTEMDVEVDGAWLRNTDVSRLRPAAETDELVYELSRRQLALLTAPGPLRIQLYQTGLETAVIGFYRALTEHLIEAPGSVAVVPMYFRRGREEVRVGGSRQESGFAPGKEWAV